MATWISRDSGLFGRLLLRLIRLARQPKSSRKKTSKVFGVRVDGPAVLKEAIFLGGFLHDLSRKTFLRMKSSPGFADDFLAIFGLI